jgi:large subunit ribosomal protein L32
MAIPFRRHGKAVKRRRRSHYKLTAPNLVVCPQTGEYTLSHRVTPNSGYYNGKLVLPKKVKDETQKASKPAAQKAVKPAKPQKNPDNALKKQAKDLLKVEKNKSKSPSSDKK